MTEGLTETRKGSRDGVGLPRARKGMNSAFLGSVAGGFRDVTLDELVILGYT